VLVLAVTIIAAAIRIPELQQRPIHADEAVHGIKFGSLLEDGFYEYDKHEYHGPTLNYLTLIPAWFGGNEKLIEINEGTLRIVPVFLSLLMIPMALLLKDALGKAASVLVGFFTAISPAMVFYSRYYIQETLLICFTFGVIVCGWRCVKDKKIIWAVLCGMFAGLMHATKETCIIAFGSIIFALIITDICENKRFPTLDRIKNVNWRHVFVGVVTAVVVSVLFYSSFFNNPQGVLDSILTYTTYFDRAGGSQVHDHPWYYYLKMLLYSRIGDGPLWTESLIVFLSLIGFAAAVTGRKIINGNVILLRFTAFYTLSMTVIYSVIPYKTPWCMLGFLHGMIILAAFGVVLLYKLAKNKIAYGAISLVLACASGFLAWQAYAASYKYNADPVNPYVYAHPLPDVVKIPERIEEIASVHPDGSNMYIQVICHDNDYWPLPWYLRGFPNISWQNKVQEDKPIAEVIIASDELKQEVLGKLYFVPPPGQRNLYVPLFDTEELPFRPQVGLIGLVRNDLWEKFIRAGK
jgi:uncharacterized protein (TIGR03663 family)